MAVNFQQAREECAPERRPAVSTYRVCEKKVGERGFSQTIRSSTLIALFTIICCLPCFAIHLSIPFDDADQLYLPSTGPPIHYDRIHNLGLGNGADSHVLDQPIKFTHIHQIGLESDQSNAENLTKLTTNYPRLKRLEVLQNVAVTDDAILLLAKFIELRDLDLDCPLTTPNLLTHCLPSSLKTLNFGARANVGDHLTTSLDLPNVIAFDIRGCKLDGAFFSNCHAPRLRTIKLGNVKLRNGALIPLASFPGLKTIEIWYGAKFVADKSPDFDKEIEYLRNHGVHVKEIPQRD